MQAKQTGEIVYQTRYISVLTLFVLLALFLLSGCTNQYAVDIKQQHADVVAQLSELGDRIDDKALTNIKLVDVYALKLKTLKPELKPISDSMMKDASRQGPLFQNLKKRLNGINLEPENQHQFSQSSRTLNTIAQGADPIIFNDSLLDLINTMADLSEGVLKRVNIPERAKKAKTDAVVPGSYLIGNPNYGEFREDSSGKSFWHWYGQYAFFSNLFSGPSYYRKPIYYGSWYSKPRYSYYNDYGLNTYGSHKHRLKTKTLNGKMRSQGLTPAKPSKQYGSVAGQKRVSTYSKNQSSSNRKYGSNNTGPRHANKTTTKNYGSKNSAKTAAKTYGTDTSSKRTSSYGKSPSSTTSSNTKRTSSYAKTSSSSSSSKRSSSYSSSSYKRSSYSSSSRSSYRSSGK